MGAPDIASRNEYPLQTPIFRTKKIRALTKHGKRILITRSAVALQLLAIFRDGAKRGEPHLGSEGCAGHTFNAISPPHVTHPGRAGSRRRRWGSANTCLSFGYRGPISWLPGGPRALQENIKALSSDAPKRKLDVDTLAAIIAGPNKGIYTRKV